MQAKEHCGGIFIVLALVACSQRAALPPTAPSEASLGRCGAPLDQARLCGDWAEAVADCDGDATVHDSLPELSERSCYVVVRHEGDRARPDPTPPGCGYPRDVTVARERLTRERERYERVAAGDGSEPPLALACGLPEAERRLAAAHNASALASLAGALRDGVLFPYAAISTFGYGAGEMEDSPLVPWRPGDPCLDLDKREMDRLSVNVQRAGMAASAFHGRVAPLVTVSGGAIHAPLYEAFALLHLLSCRFDVPADAVLLDPCADHTHTNLRNTGSLVVGLGGRQAYAVTDDGLQGGYLQEWTAFWLVGGTIDQRALRDWGYLVGAWRQASVGYDAGFWFTPYRFWGEPPDGLGGATCVE